MKAKEIFQLPSGVTLKNRLIFAPISTMEDPLDGKMTSDELNFFKLRTGAVGAIVVGSAYVSPDGRGYGNNISITHDRYIDSLSQVASTIQQDNTKAFLQIYHAGANAKSKKWCVSCESQNIVEEKDYQELSTAEIERIIKDYQEAVLRAIKAGFDGVELHMANSYLPNQFMMPSWNVRQDEWGGSRERRLNFAKRIIESSLEVIKQHAKTPFALGIRFSLEDTMLLEDNERDQSFKESLMILKELDNMTLDYVHVTSSDILSKKELEGYSFELLDILKQVLLKTPLIGSGNLLQAESVEKTLEKTELASACRPFIFQPDWAQCILNQEEVVLPNNQLTGEMRQTYQIPRNLWRGILEASDWYLYR
ncbi:oxidoreductase [Vagococcus hydrophili]|nr:hypothetical protein [Vagococcus hydrophili]